MWLFLTTFATAVAAKQAQASILISDYTINAQPSIQLYVFPSDNQPYTETSFTATFPSFIGFQILQSTPQCYEAPLSQQVSNYNNRLPQCQLASQPDGSVVLTVTNLRTAGATPPNQYGVQFTGLQNPGAATVSQQNGVGVVVTTFNGTAMNEQIQTNFFEFSPISSTRAVLISSNNLQNGAVGSLQLTATVSQSIPINGTVSIELPLQNQQYQSLGATTQKSMLVQPTTVSVVIQNTSLSQSQYTVTSQSIKIDLNNMNPVNPGATVVVTVSQIQMPPCNGPLSGFLIATGDKNYHQIEIMQGVLQTTKAGSAFGSIAMSSYGILETNQTYTFALNTTNDLPNNSYFTLSIPDGVLLQPSNISCASVCAYTYSNKVLTVSFENQYLKAPGPLLFSISGFTNPASTAPSLFKWQSYAKLSTGDYLIDQVSNLTIQAQKGTCVVSQFFPTDLDFMIYATASNWTVQVTCQHAFTTLQITFPSTFTIDCSKNTCANTQNTIIASNISKSMFALYGITNPSQINQNPLVFVINAMTQNIVVDMGNFTMEALKIQPGFVKTFTVSPQDYTLGNYPVYYDVAFQTSGDISTNATILLTIPNQQTQLSLSSPIGFTSSNITVTIQSSQITISNGFAVSTNQIQMQNTGPKIKFTLGPFQNPRNYNNQSFTLQVNNAFDQVLYKPQSTVVQMQGPALFKNITVLRDSVQNSNITNYNFTIIPTNQIFSSDQLVIQFPPQITLIKTACFGLSSNLKYNLQCTVTNNMVTITVQTMRRLQSLISSYQFQITQVKNAVTMQPTQSIKVFLFSNDLLIEQQTTNLIITNQKPGGASQVSVIPDSFDTSIYTNYTFAWKPTEFQEDQTVVLIVPEQLKLSSNFSCSIDCTVDGQKITFKNTSSALNKVTMGPILNPPPGLQTTDSFQAMTYSPQGFLIESQTSQLSINFFCVYPCSTCDSVKKTSCNSCYSGGNYSTWFNNSCVDTCPIGLAKIQNNCTTCSVQCLTCEGTASQCLQCNTGYFMLQTGRCEQIVYWPFPFIVFSMCAFLVVLVAECRNSSSSFKDSFLAFLGLAEFGAWVTFTVFCYLKQNLTYTTYGCFISVGIYLLLNLIFAIVHSCKIIKGNQSYRELMASSKCMRASSYLVSFKFSAISVSNLCNANRFKGEYTAQNEKDFNVFLLVFMVTAYPLMMVCCVYHLIQYGFFNYPGFIAVECIGISTVAQAVALMDALSVLSCKNQKVKIGTYQLKSGVDYESDNDLTKSPLKSKKMTKVNEAAEFGRDDEEDPNISKNLTNQSLIDTDVQQLIKQMEQERIQDRQQLLDQQKEHLKHLEQLVQLYHDPDKIMKYVDDKINQADSLNKQVLREIYEEQMQMMKNGLRKDYRDFEALMDQQSLFEGPHQMVVSERISMLPLSQLESERFAGQKSPQISNDDLEVFVKNGVDAQHKDVVKDGFIFSATNLTPINDGKMSVGYQTSEVFLNKQKGVYSNVQSQLHRSQELNMQFVQMDAAQEMCSNRELQFNSSQLNPAQVNPTFETVSVASKFGEVTQAFGLQALASNRGLEREGSEAYHNLAALISNRGRELEREGSEAYHNLAVLTSNRGQERVGNTVVHECESQQIELAVEQVDSSSGPQDQLSKRSAQTQNVYSFQKTKYNNPDGGTEKHFGDIHIELQVNTSEKDAETQKLKKQRSTQESEMTSKTQQNVQMKGILQANEIKFTKPIDHSQRNSSAGSQNQSQAQQKVSPTFAVASSKSPTPDQSQAQPKVSPAFAVASSKSPTPDLNVSAKSVKQFYDSALVKVSPTSSKLIKTPVKQERQIKDAYGHSESSEGIVNHDLFSTINHFHSIQYIAPTGLVKTRNQSQPHLSKRQQHILYSDRSESSVADMMDDTPSNYNIPNGRLDGKSQGLKAIVNSMQRGKTPESKSSVTRRKNHRSMKSFAETKPNDQL